MLASLTTKHKIILGSLVFLIVVIPLASFVISYRFRAQLNSQASNGNGPTIEDLSLRPIIDKPLSKKSLLDELKEDLEASEEAEEQDLSKDILTSGSTLLSLGPTLTFKLNIEGRPKTKQQDPKLFVGIAAGQAATNPQYLLSFTVDASASGEPKELLPLSGLSTGETYTAYLKGQTTLVAASTFTAKPTAANLGTVNLLTGDLNDDNAVTQSDKDILMKSYGAREGSSEQSSSSSKWNPLADFNLDGVINTADLAYITKNMNKDGASGPWSSKLPASATSSATPSGNLNKQGFPLDRDDATPAASPYGGPRDVPGNQKGYWLWVPSAL